MLVSKALDIGDFGVFPISLVLPENTSGFFLQNFKLFCFVDKILLL